MSTFANATVKIKGARFYGLYGVVSIRWNNEVTDLPKPSKGRLTVWSVTIIIIIIIILLIQGNKKNAVSR